MTVSTRTTTKRHGRQSHLTKAMSLKVMQEVSLRLRLRPRQVLVALVALLLLTAAPPLPAHARSMNRNNPHEHNGKLAPYTPGPFTTLALTKKDEDELGKDRAVMKQIPAATDDADADANAKNGEGGANSGGRAICVQDVQAPKSAVWNQILDLDHYVGKVNKLKECRNYLVKKTADGRGWQIKTKMVVGVLPGYSYEYYCDHTYRPDLDSVVWTLDYDRTSDFDDVAGHWHLEDHPRKKGCTRVYYACDIKFKRPVPGPVLNFLTKSALKQATGWVKRESEAKALDSTLIAPFGTAATAAAGAPSSSGEL